MKKLYVFIVVAIIAVVGMMQSCHENIIDDTVINDFPIKAYANLNPAEPIVLDVSDERGRSVVLMGKKSATGHAELMEQMIITMPDEENPTEVFFNEDEMVKEIIAPSGVRFQFEWMSETKAALTLIDPNTNEQLNTVIDLLNPAPEMQVQNTTNTKSVPAVTREAETTLTVEPSVVKMENESSLLTRSSGGVVGNLYLVQCGVPQDAQCWVNVYEPAQPNYDLGKFRGRFWCTRVSEGHYQFTLPSNYHEHHDLADYCDNLNDFIGVICDLNAFTSPNSGYKQVMCYYISSALATGIVSAPAAALFAAACVTISTALDAGCSLLNGYLEDLPEGTPTLLDGLCGVVREMDYSWDTPLILVPMVNALPSNIRGSWQYWDAGTSLKDMTIKWGGKPIVKSFKLIPSAPAEGVSYTAVAELSCLPPSTQIIMDIIGTDGYTDKETYAIGIDSNISYTAKLNVPGAASGVKDVCTVTIITPSGETVTKKASLVFQ